MLGCRSCECFIWSSASWKRLRCDISNRSKSLEHLSLNGVAIDDELIEALAQLSQLKIVELYRHRMYARWTSHNCGQALPETQLYIDPQLADAERKLAGRNLNSVQDGLRTHPTKDRRNPILGSHRRSLRRDGRSRLTFKSMSFRCWADLAATAGLATVRFKGKAGFGCRCSATTSTWITRTCCERIDLDSPDDSLILNKPTSADEHEGGLRLPPGGWEQRLLRRWIEGGAKVSDKTHRHSSGWM